MPPIHWLNPHDGNTDFPPIDQALDDPNGLLAAGGDLSPERLLEAYRRGIFPWYNAGQPILWWSPDPRMVLFPERLKISRSLRKSLHRSPYTITLDTAFRAVMAACAEPRPNQDGTWISADMIEAYCKLHALGYAHSAEAWHEGALVGGLYGVAIGRVFYGESMFAHETDASKIAFVYLVQQLRRWGYGLIDCQVYTEHLRSLGAEELPRQEFINLLERYRTLNDHSAPWQLESFATPL